MDSKNNSAFLEKFKGKTNIVGRRGLTHIIENINLQNPLPTQSPGVISRRRSGKL
jgi:hypothetical protein